ncbi:MAG: 4Fe-4S dicluster domain-containing protein [Candidatus Latescibacterota bacterium]|nr:MAG: 4Fe-4S dicluster domain-containing protein [Candidatus Latescibacterota bacterium]
MKRREFVQLMGLASGASLLSSCGLERETEKLIPYLVPPDDGVIPGKAVHVNTTCTECPANCGMTVKVMDRRAAKLEGNPAHPVSTGGMCMRGQASISRLYHPGRLKHPLGKNDAGDFEEMTWEDAYAAIVSALKTSPSASAARDNVFLSSRTTGTLTDVVDSFCDETGVERLPEFELYSYASIREANRILFDRAEIPSYRIEDADFVLSLGADLFETFVNPVSHAAQFGRTRRRGDWFNWVHVEPHVSLTGLQADERHVIAPGGEVYLLLYLLREVSRENVAGERHIAGMVESFPDMTPRAYAEKTGLDVHVLESIATKLLTARNPLALAGGVSTMQHSGLDVAVLAGLLQWATGMTWSTVVFDKPGDFGRVGSVRDIDALVKRLQSNQIGVFFVCDVDLRGTAVQDALGNAALTVGFGDFMTGTLEACDIVLPLSHPLESWADATPRADVVGIIQPAITPVHDTRSAGDILIRLAREYQGAQTSLSYQELLLGRLKSKLGTAAVERLLDDGVVRRQADISTVGLNRAVLEPYLKQIVFNDSVVKPVLIVAPSIRAFDGRGDKLALLREIPDPLTTVSYGDWVSVARTDADEKGLKNGDEVIFKVRDSEATVPVMVQKGLARGIMVIHRGAGLPGAVTEPGPLEYNTIIGGASIAKTGTKAALPILSGSTDPEDRPVVPQPGHEAAHGHHEGDPPTFYPPHEHEDYRWGMVVDLDLCIGCSACTAACYIENNVPVVGPDLHLDGREMAWLRIEPFYNQSGTVDFLPMMCQHCENAPCETVCPVYATYHNPEGLNAQVYNRCVGTRYCSNNCPYKVRRFNWFDHKRPTADNATQNPEVSVRSRGVMEKCTFCVQRIRAARDTAKDEKRLIREGEVTPACAQTCPTQAITFGNLMDPESRVSKLAHSERAFQALGHLGADPGVFYLKNKRHGIPDAHDGRHDKNHG